MNKNILAICVGVALLSAACNKQNDTGEQENSTLVAARIKVNDSEMPGTRASVTPDNEALDKGEKFTWNTGDELALTLLPSSSSAATWHKFTIATDFKTGSQADFTGNITHGVAGDLLYGMSPWRSDYATDIKQVPITCAVVKTQTNDAATNANTTNHLSSLAYMYAKTAITKPIVEGSDVATLPHLSFKHLCALLRFRVRNANSTPCKVTKIEIKHSNDTDTEHWFGINAYINLTTSPKATILLDKMSQSLTLNIENCMELAQSSTFKAGKYLNAYLPLLPTRHYVPESIMTDYLFITVTLDDASAITYALAYKSVDFLKDGLKAGWRYYFNVTINSNSLQIDEMGSENLDFENTGSDNDIIIKN